jgi:hypothetical protein
VAITPSNHGKPWALADQKQLLALAEKNVPTGLLSYKLGRTEDAIRSKAQELKVSLKPTNQSPYNRQKK